MADINGVTLNAGSSPVVSYTITYTKSRTNNSEMIYYFTISAALGSSGSFIGTGYALACVITINGAAFGVRIKEEDNDNWEGTTPRIRYNTVTCPSDTGNTEQGVRFHVYSDGRLTLTSGVIDNSSYTVLSSPLFATACVAPTAFALSATLAEGTVNLAWSGASGGAANAITGYDIEYRDSTDNSTWGVWEALGVISTSSASGNVTTSPPITRGNYRQFRIMTRGSAGVSFYSDWALTSNTVRKNVLPTPPTVFTATPAVYEEATITLAWSGTIQGTSAIKQYIIQKATSTDGVNWSTYEAVATIVSSATSGTYMTNASLVSGIYTSYRISATDVLSAISAYVTSNTVKKNSPPNAPIINCPQTGASTYNVNPRFMIIMGNESDGQTQILEVKIDSGLWLNSVDNPEFFSTNGYLTNGVKTIFQAPILTEGNHTITFRSLDSDVRSPRAEVLRTITILPSPFETITAGVTPVKATHIKAIRDAVNTARNYYCLSAFSWNGDITAGKSTIKDWPLHIMEIRRAIVPPITKINGFDSDSSTFDLPPGDWKTIGTGRPDAEVMAQLHLITFIL